MTSVTAQASVDATAARASAPPLIARLAQAHAWVGAEDLDDFLAAHPGDVVLFVWSDPIRFPESLDVAVVLPELLAHASGPGAPRFKIAVVDALSEDTVARRYGAQRRPSLIFLRDGQYVDTVAGMLDWEPYAQAVDQALAAPTRRAPGVGIPLVGEAGASCH